MSAPIKRRGDPSCDQISSKKILLDGSDEKLESFLKWCDQNDFKLTPKVRVCLEGSCSRYGMVAVEDIAEGYPLFQIPRHCLLTPENSGVSKILLKESKDLSATNQWVPLLISLLHEQSDPSSKWRPYLDLVPDYKNLDLPMFWESSDVVKHLQGTGVDIAVKKDCEMIQNDFDSLVEPFFQKHPELRTDKVKLDYFKKMVAFVMAYSFTEPENSHESDDSDDEDEEEPVLKPPMMVPMADILNHVTDNNAKLTFGENALKMVTTKPIKKGEEVFNTYGQISNLHLLHMYNFAEQYPLNTNDVVEIPASNLLQASIDLLQKDESSSFVKEKWKFLNDQEVLSDDEIFVLGVEGIVTDDICHTALKVMSMSQAEYSNQVEQEGWSDAESDDSLSGESKLSFERIPEIKESWRLLLKRMTEIHLSCYPSSLAENMQRLTDAETKAMTNRERFSLYTALGQKELLHKLINACNKIVDQCNNCECNKS